MVCSFAGFLVPFFAAWAAASVEASASQPRDEAMASAVSIKTRIAGKRLGPPDNAAEQLLVAIKDLDRLDRMHDRLTDTPGAVSGWDDLLETP